MYFLSLKPFIHLNKCAYECMYKYAYTCYEQSEFSDVSVNVADFLLHLKDRIVNNYTTSLKIGKVCTAF